MICGIIQTELQSVHLLCSVVGSHLGTVIMSGMDDYKCYSHTNVTLCWSSCLLKPHLDLGKLAWILAPHVCEVDEGREIINLNDLTI